MNLFKPENTTTDTQQKGFLKTLNQLVGGSSPPRLTSINKARARRNDCPFVFVPQGLRRSFYRSLIPYR
jgi:hypothetical protein